MWNCIGMWVSHGQRHCRSKFGILVESFERFRVRNRLREHTLGKSLKQRRKQRTRPIQSGQQNKFRRLHALSGDGGESAIAKVAARYRCFPPNTAKNTNNASNIPHTKKKIFHPDFGDSPTTSPDCPFTKNR